MLDQVNLIEFPKIIDNRGTLSYVENEEQIPFTICRVFYIYNVPNSDIIRGEHAHRRTEQVIIPVNGTIELTLRDADNSKCFNLSDPSVGVYVPPKVWNEITSFSQDAVVLVLASTKFNEGDYINDIDKLNTN